MTLVLDTRQDNYGNLYTSSGPRSSEVLENRRRRFSWTTPVFSGEDTVTYENVDDVTLKVKKKQQDGEKQATIQEPKFEGKNSKPGGRFNIVRQNSLAKALKFFRGLSRNQSKKGQSEAAATDDKTSETTSHNTEESANPSVEDFVIDSKGRESITVPKDLVEKAIMNQNETGTELLNSKLRGSAKVESDPSSPANDGSFPDSGKTSRGTKSHGKSSSSQSKKKSSRKEGSDGQNRYMVNENGKIVPVNGHSHAPRGILKVTDFPINGKPVSEEQKARNRLSRSSKRSMSNIPRNRRSVISIKTKGEKKFRFNEFVVIFETYAMDEYDRRMGVRLEDNLCNTTNIKLELNEFKSKEMVVHPESRKYTHFLNI